MQENGINWTVVATIAAPIITLLVGAVLNRALESKARLISYYGHASSFLIREGVEQPSWIHTHSVVLRNVGRKPAKNVRLGHNVLRHFQVYPNREYKIIELDGGGKEILFPELIAGDQVSVSYLYFPPTTYRDVNTYAKSDEGFAKLVDAIPTPQPGKWVTRLAVILMLAGAVAILYVAWMRVVLPLFRG